MSLAGRYGLQLIIRAPNFGHRPPPFCRQHHSLPIHQNVQRGASAFHNGRQNDSFHIKVFASLLAKHSISVSPFPSWTGSFPNGYFRGITHLQTLITFQVRRVRRSSQKVNCSFQSALSDPTHQIFELITDFPLGLFFLPPKKSVLKLRVSFNTGAGG